MNNRCIEYQKIYPCNYLKKYIEYYWIMKGRDREHLITLMPDVRPCMFFLNKSAARYIHTLKGKSFIDNHCEIVGTNKPPMTTLTSGFLGAHHDYKILNIKGELEVFGVQFSIAGACAFLGDITSAFANQIVSIDKISVLKHIKEQNTDILQTSNIATVFDNCFLELLFHNVGHDIDAVNRLNIVADSQNIWHNTVDMAAKNCIGVRQQERWFKKYIGITPRCFKTIHRFRSALRELLEGCHLGQLENLAFDFGYNNLPHMTRDFIKLCGVTPGRLSEYLSASKVYYISSNLMCQVNSDLNCRIWRF